MAPTVRGPPPEGDEPILDVCTAPAIWHWLITKRTRGRVPDLPRTSVPKMLEFAEAKKRKACINGNLTFLEADTQSLPFDADTFQLVTVAFGFAQRRRYRPRAARHDSGCRPGGRVAILEFSEPQWQPMKALYGWYFRNVLPRLSGIGHPREPPGPLPIFPKASVNLPKGKPLARKDARCGYAGGHLINRLRLESPRLYVGNEVGTQADAPLVRRPRPRPSRRFPGIEDENVGSEPSTPYLVIRTTYLVTHPSITLGLSSFTSNTR